MEQTIFGRRPKNPAAHGNHPCGSLPVKQMKRKGCLGKQCRHLQKNEQHEYWRQRELAKARKKSVSGLEISDYLS